MSHSNISHLLALLRHAKADGVQKAYCHILLDGRDVPATSALEYVKQLEECAGGAQRRDPRVQDRLRRRPYDHYHGPL